MPVIALRTIGRFGNQLVSYLFARAYAEAHGCELQTENWIGQRVFVLDDPPISRELPRRCENTLINGEVDVEYHCSYSQQQKCMIWTRAQARQWLRIRPHLLAQIEPFLPSGDRVLAHRRVGDYLPLGYVVPTVDSYVRACREFGYDPAQLRFITEENPTVAPGLPDNLSFLPDFVRLMRAPVLFRANSTFSFIAGVLNNGEVYCPVIDGLVGGREHDVQFVRGNHKKFANLDYVTDLHLPEP